MADFRTHVAFSGLLGCGYATASYFVLDLSPVSCCLAGGLCGLAGMLPDLDSNNSVPLREILAFSASVVPLLMIERFEMIGLSREAMVLAGAAVYLAIRFGFGNLLKKCTIHRGMFHSLPAALIAGLAAFLICDGFDPHLRVLKAGAIFVGFISHLCLDECYSIERVQGKWRLKKSFGTALKLSGGSVGGTSAAYGMLLLLTLLTIGDTLAFQPGPTNDGPVPPPMAVRELETKIR